MRWCSQTLIDGRTSGRQQQKKLSLLLLAVMIVSSGAVQMQKRSLEKKSQMSLNIGKKIPQMDQTSGVLKRET